MTTTWTVIHDEWANYYSVFNGDELIAELFYAENLPEDQEQQRVKASTIAAAPAMLEALTRVNHLMRSKVISDQTYTTLTLGPGEVALIREALRIARGGAS